MIKFALLTICALTTVTALAQLPKEVKVGLPQILSGNILSEQDVVSINSANNWGQNNKTNRYWVVWSDRADNTTYNGPGVSFGQKGHLRFNEQVRIAEIQNNFAHVYVEEQTHRPYPQITQPTDKGWVPMNNLLLWNSCPTNERGIYNKALIVVNLSSKVNEVKNLFKVYTNPVTKTDRGYAISSIDVRYVMKEDKETGMVLLSNESSLEGTSDQMLNGWFEKDAIVKWNQRVCLEPNWDVNVVEYFKSKNEQLKIFENADLTGNPITKPFTFGSIMNKDGRNVDRYRMPKGSLRYPILESKEKLDENVYYINVFASNGRFGMDSLEASFNEAFMVDRLGKEHVSFIKNTNNIISAPGYTPKRDKEGHDYWKTVIYISSAELDHLLHQLQGVYNAAKISDYTNREPYVNAFKGIIKAMIPEITDERMNAMSQEEIMAQIVGLNAQTETTRTYTLQQIVNSKVVSDPTYANIIAQFAEKYDNLNRIKTSSYPFRLQVNNNTYYWIPTEMIP